MSRLGVCYQGSKNQIAKAIVAALPSGKRFCDLFAGGCAVTHAAILSHKYETYLLNDLHGFGVRLFRDAIEGKCNGAWRHWVSREEFFAKRDTDPLVALCWSFGNNQAQYLYGKNVEERKRKEFEAYLRNGVMQSRQRNVERMQSLVQVEALERLQALEFTFASYADYEHRDGDVVYCDIPYASATEGYRFMKRSGLAFDHAAFWEWARTREYPVYVSESTAPDDFAPIWERQKRSIMKMHDCEYRTRRECVFVHERFCEKETTK
jgi:site-specific DNA-adenine methylase